MLLGAAWASGATGAAQPAGKCADYVSDALARDLLGIAISEKSAATWTAIPAVGQTIYDCHWVANAGAGSRERELYLRVHEFTTQGMLKAMSWPPLKGSGVKSHKLPQLGEQGLFWWHTTGGEATILGSKGLRVVNITINRNFEAALPNDIEARLLKIVTPLYGAM